MAAFYAAYPGNMTEDDRFRLDRPGFQLRENGYCVSAPWRGDEPPPSEFTTYQVIRVSADSAADARRQIVEALGREPDELQVHEGKLRF